VETPFPKIQSDVYEVVYTYRPYTADDDERVTHQHITSFTTTNVIEKLTTAWPSANRSQVFGCSGFYRYVLAAKLWMCIAIRIFLRRKNAATVVWHKQSRALTPRSL